MFNLNLDCFCFFPANLTDLFKIHVGILTERKNTTNFMFSVKMYDFDSKKTSNFKRKCFLCKFDVPFIINYLAMLAAFIRLIHAIIYAIAQERIRNAFLLRIALPKVLLTFVFRNFTNNSDDLNKNKTIEQLSSIV